MKIFGMEIDRELLEPKQASYLEQYSGIEKPAVDAIWREMDRIWDDLGLDNRRRLHNQPVAAFYSHPVWILNGLFTAQDEESRKHREAIARKVADLQARNVADYGGGFGALAMTIADACDKATISIIEPYPSRLGKARVGGAERIGFQDALKGAYDVIIAQDVLEHVEDPVSLVDAMVNSLQVGGYAIFANCFYPVIKCHLPCTFHLRHTFRWIMAPLGLQFAGRVKGAEHALVFRRVRERSDLQRARSLESLARIMGPAVNRGVDRAAIFKRLIARTR